MFATDSQNGYQPIPREYVFSELQAVLTSELAALQKLCAHLPTNAELIIHQLLATTGKIIFSGLGKSGLVARKLAATFSGLGTPALFLHPTDALHGDLGVIQPNDLFIALSKSGTGSELSYIFSYLKQHQIPSVLICCSLGHLARQAQLVIQLPYVSEACHLALAPSSSSTMMLAFGDALAIVTSRLKQFTESDFAQVHAGGSLGRQLLLTVSDLMHTGVDLPLLPPDASFQDVILTISKKKLGSCIIITPDEKLLGIVTDGDLRRACNHYGAELFNHPAQIFMTTNPKIISPSTRALEALEQMSAYGISSLVVIEHEKVVGFIHLHDLVKAGLTT